MRREGGPPSLFQDRPSKIHSQGSGQDSAEEQAPSVPDYVPTPIGEERGGLG